MSRLAANNPHLKLTHKAKLWTGKDLGELPVKEVKDAIAIKLAESDQ